MGKAKRAHQFDIIICGYVVGTPLRAFAHPTCCDALHYVPRKGSELRADVPKAIYVGLPLLREFERRRDMADEYAGCH